MPRKVDKITAPREQSMATCRISTFSLSKLSHGYGYAAGIRFGYNHIMNRNNVVIMPRIESKWQQK